MSAQQLCNDSVFIEHPNRTQAGPYNCFFTPEKITIFDESLSLTAKHKFLRPQEDGQAECYDILDFTFSPRHLNMPAHWDFSVQANGSVPFVHTKMPAQAPAIAIAKAKPTSLADALGQILGAIQKSPALTREKEEAKFRLRRLVEHPTIKAALGEDAQKVLDRLS
jgi:hypothetical protein